MNAKEKIEKEKLFNDNIKLAYMVIGRYKNIARLNYEEVEQTALLALWKAVVKYDESISKFSTFAVRTIENELMYYYRRMKKHINVISYEIPIAENLTLEDSIPDPNDNFEFIETRNDIETALNKIKLSNLQKQIIELIKGGVSNQKVIASKLGVSQPTVSRNIKYIKNKVERLSGNHIHKY